MWMFPYQLFDYIVDCLEDFLKEKGVHGQMSLGFTFSFPVKQNGLASGTLLHWTKEIDCAGVVGKDVVVLLQQAIDKRKVLYEYVLLYLKHLFSYLFLFYNQCSI